MNAEITVSRTGLYNITQASEILGIDSNVVDVFCYLVLGSAFYPAGKAVEKEEDYV